MSNLSGHLVRAAVKGDIDRRVTALTMTPVHLSTNQIAYYQVGLRGKTKTNLLRSESVAKLCLPVEGLELEIR